MTMKMIRKGIDYFGNEKSRLYNEEKIAQLALGVVFSCTFPWFKNFSIRLMFAVGKNVG